MGNSISNLMGMLIAILGGTFFFVTYCSPCNGRDGIILNETTIDTRIRANLNEKHTSGRTGSSEGLEIPYKDISKDSLLIGAAPGSEVPSGRRRTLSGT